MRVTAAHSGDFWWLHRRTSCPLTSDMTGIKAVDRFGHIRGMVAYCNVTPNAVHMHMALDAPIAARALLGPALDYAFQEGKKRVAIGMVPARNIPSIRLAKHVGFVETHRVKDGWAAGEDLVFLELRKENCIQMRKAA